MSYRWGGDNINDGLDDTGRQREPLVEDERKQVPRILGFEIARLDFQAQSTYYLEDLIRIPRNIVGFKRVNDIRD